jgi:hypothetical protein
MQDVLIRAQLAILPRTDSGVSVTTVRAHVRGVLEKIGCHRQGEVVALLSGIASPRRPDAS